MSTQANPTALSPRFVFARTVRRLAERAFLLALRRLRRAGRSSGFCGANIMVCCMIRCIYMGRGLADLDPNGVGADYFYRLDGQSFLQRLLEDRRRFDPGFRPGAFGASVDRDRASPLAGGDGGSRRTARERAAEMGDFDLRRRVERRLWRASAAIRRGLRYAAAVRRGWRAGGARGAARGNASARDALFGLWPRCFIPIMALAGAGRCLRLFVSRKSPLDLSRTYWRGAAVPRRGAWMACRCFRASSSASTGTG